MLSQKANYSSPLNTNTAMVEQPSIESDELDHRHLVLTVLVLIALDYHS